MTLCGPESFGADPVNIKWTVIRGDTATLKVEFFEDDEKTYFDTEGWEYKVSAYDRKNDIIDELDAVPHSGYVDITASADLTKNWGSGYSSGSIAELLFDVQVKIDNTIWTPVLGTINVLGDVTYGGSL